MKILVATDLSDESRAIIDYVKKLSRTFSVNVCLLHVAEPAPDFVGYDVDPTVMRDQTANKYHKEHRQLKQLGRELDSVGIDCTSLLIQGSTVDTILNEAIKLSVDMIVAGLYGKKAMMTLLTGSDITDMLHKSTIPVLVIPLSSARR